MNADDWVPTQQRPQAANAAASPQQFAHQSLPADWIQQQNKVGREPIQPPPVALPKVLPTALPTPPAALPKVQPIAAPIETPIVGQLL
ncbi:MAG: hypothetical protein WBD31_28585, partial [Rubripirellula sp.]